MVKKTQKALLNQINQTRRNKRNTGEGESAEKMFVLRKQVEVMIAEGKSVDESETKIETLKNILAMLQASRGSSKVDENIRKKDENMETSEKTDKAIAVAKKGETMHQDTEDNTDSINVINKYEKVILKMDVESSDKFNSDESVKENIKSIITNLDDTKMEKEQIAKTVSFAQTPGCIDTMAQLDDMLLIDESHSENAPPVTDTGQSEMNVVKGVLNELVDKVVDSQDCQADDDDLSSTPPCSQMPRIDPYACQKETS